MRKVKYKKWIPAVCPEKEKSFTLTWPRPIEGTACWEKEFLNEGIFHQWANTCIEHESGARNYTVAIVELPDGTVAEVLPSNIKFVE